jgi:hypothetical protein
MQFNTAGYRLLRVDAKRFAGRGDALNDAEPTKMTSVREGLRDLEAAFEWLVGVTTGPVWGVHRDE